MSLASTINPSFASDGSGQQCQRNEVITCIYQGSLDCSRLVHKRPETELPELQTVGSFSFKHRWENVVGLA